MTLLRDVSLDDKYTLAEGRVFLTGIQALVRAPLAQQELDASRGHATAGYISGYRGSPLGMYDQQLTRAQKHLDAHHVVFLPGVNEDLAATACSGTQQAGLDGENTYDGVFAIWYGKGPGVDRSGDALRHGNLFGTSALGGVLCLLGDDHTCESSTTAHQSEYAMIDAMIPVLNPAGVQEILDYSLAGIAMSRYSGAFVALKCMHDTVESTASIDIAPARWNFALPEEHQLPAGGLNIRWPDTPLQMEERLHRHKLEAAKAFARANRLDRVVLGGDDAWLGVVTTGKSYMDLVQALEDLGIDEGRATALGLRVYKVAMTWPLEPANLATAMSGLTKVVVFEEKRGLIEQQVREQLYGTSRPPVIVGKADEWGAPLFPSHGALTSNRIAIAIARRLLEHRDDADLRARLAEAEARGAVELATPALARLPYFCPGCPHNSSTKVPDGSKARAGIGCHYMVQWMDRETARYTQMGGEGASWIGEAPFVTRPHVFQNIGDGTFYHSGSLAIRAAIAAHVNITFKVLYNDAVAMTGGQRMEIGNLSVPQVVRELEAEGVGEIVVVTDEPGKYPLGSHFPAGVRIVHRDELDAVQRRLRDIPGVTAIVYDQTCAAEKRRRRKRGEFPDPDKRVFINEAVCEGCGDCGVQSNCVAVQPVETELGRKRRIDQSACNKDFSCLKGFCPSFVTVEGATLRKAKPQARTGVAAPAMVLPEPVLPALDGVYGIVVTGVGGTGVVTIGAVFGMAAHLEGKGCALLDMIGLAQKGGAVLSHIKLAATPETIGSPRIDAGAARLIVGCDMVVAGGTAALRTVSKGRTRMVVNTVEAMTGDFTRQPDLQFPTVRLQRGMTAAAGEGAVEFVAASQLAERLVGDAIGANLLLVGYAWQKGLIPLSRAAIARAIELNGVAVASSLDAFGWGRRLAHDPASVAAAAGDLPAPKAPLDLDQTIGHRAAFLEAYQNTAYATRYRAAVASIRASEKTLAPGRTGLAEAVAQYLFKLMAYKDEYEVARLYSDGEFRRRLDAAFEGKLRVTMHLAPPLLAPRDPKTGQLGKMTFGPWMLKAMGVLAKLRGLRGTPFDIFGYTTERKAERQLIHDYEAMLGDLARSLTQDNHATAVALAALPEGIRGYGHVKERSIQLAKVREVELLAAFRQPEAALQAAE